MKLYAVMKVEHISQWIGNVPAIGQLRLNIQMFVAGEQVIKDQVVNPLGLSIQSNPRIEVGWAIFNQHDERVVIGFRAARKKRNHQQKQESQSHGRSRRAAIRHRKSSPGWRGVSRRWQWVCSRAGGARFRRRAKRRRWPPSLLMAHQIHRRSEVASRAAAVHWQALP